VKLRMRGAQPSLTPVVGEKKSMDFTEKPKYRMAEGSLILGLHENGIENTMITGKGGRGHFALVVEIRTGQGISQPG